MTYNPVRREIDDLRRFKEIVTILFDAEFGLILDHLNVIQHVPLLKRLRHRDDALPSPVRVRRTFERLGPTFIKFGQIMAQRPDILPQPYIKELEKLEDSVPAFDSDLAVSIVESELGPIEETFSHFEREPLAAASIAQVHRARLNSGEEVVVKIRRPGIKEQMEEDLDILMFLAKEGEKHIKRLEHMRAHKSVKEFARWTKDELNLKKEARNAQAFAINLRDEDRVKIPKVYPEHTTERVMVMEYVDGVKSNDAEALREMDVAAEDIARTAVRAGLKQIIRDGFFHADPHPSNFLINEDGQLIYLDFGMIGRFSKTTRRNLGLLLLHSMNEDIDAAFETTKRMAYVEPDADLEAVKEEMEENLMAFKNTTLEESSISIGLFNVAVSAANHGVHMPSTLIIMAKSMVTMEGIGMAIYPEFQPSDEFKPVVRKLLKELASPRDILQTLAIDLLENQDLISRLPSHLSELLDGLSDQTTTVTVETGGHRIGRDMVIAALLISSSLILLESLPTDILPLLGVLQLGLAALLLLTR